MAGEILEGGENLDLEVDGGGEGEGGGVPQDGGEGGGTARDPRTGKFVPIERFNEVYGQSKQYERDLGSYRTFGKPEELKGKLEKLAAWEKAVEEQRRVASMTPDDKAKAEKAKVILSQLYEIVPGLKNLDKLGELQQRIEDLQGMNETQAAEATLSGHSQTFTDVLKAAKIDPQYQEDIESFIVSKMTSEDKAAFIKGDFSPAQKIFEASLKSGLLSKMRSHTPLPPVPVRNSTGGTGAKGGKEKPMTLKEAEDAAWAMMQNRE